MIAELRFKLSPPDFPVLCCQACNADILVNWGKTVTKITKQTEQNSGGNRDQYSYNRVQYWKNMPKNNRCLLKNTHSVIE